MCCYGDVIRVGRHDPGCEVWCGVVWDLSSGVASAAWQHQQGSSLAFAMSAVYLVRHPELNLTIRLVLAAETASWS